jgi:hypothetical protein
VTEALRWVFAVLIAAWLVGWVVGTRRVVRGRSLADDHIPALSFGMIWMALGLVLFGLFPKLID